jgi:hypothetical protein
MMDWSKPKEGVTRFDVEFGPKKLSDFLPSMEEIPKDFHSWNHPWQRVVAEWFHRGLKSLPVAKDGIDRQAALAHINTILASFEPKHEHKTAGCAYLMSLWFELPKQS